MSSTDNIIILKSSDGEFFEVEKAVARRSPTISHLIDGGIPDDGILIPKVTGKILSKVIEYCKKHVCDIDRDDSVAGDDLEAWDAEVDMAALLDLIGNFSELIVRYKEPAVDLKAWDVEFVEVDPATLFPLMKAAYDLKIESLVNLTTQNLPGRLKSKIRKEMAEIYDVEIDDTDEELNEL